MNESSAKIDPSALSKEFEKRVGTFEALKNEACFALEQALLERGIKFVSVPARVKQLQSFLDKVMRKEFTDPAKKAFDAYESAIKPGDAADGRYATVGVVRISFDILDPASIKAAVVPTKGDFKKYREMLQ